MVDVAVRYKRFRGMDSWVDTSVEDGVLHFRPVLSVLLREEEVGGLLKGGKWEIVNSQGAQKPLRRLIVMRGGGIGDLVMLVPALVQAEKEGYKVWLVTAEQHTEVVSVYKRFPVVTKMDSNGEICLISKRIKLDGVVEKSEDRISVDRVKLFGRFMGLNEELDGTLVRYPRSEVRVKEVRKRFGLEGRYCLVAMNAMVAIRSIQFSWIKRLAELVSDIKLVLVGSGGSAGKFNGKSLMGQTGITDLVLLMQGASFFVGADTGTSHIAEATGTPGVVIGGHISPDLRFSKYECVKRFYKDLICVKRRRECYDCLHHDIPCMSVEVKRVAVDLENRALQR